MNSARVVAVVSLCISALLIAMALASTSAMQHELKNDLSSTLGASALLFPIASLPWFLSYSKAKRAEEAKPVWVFSVLATVICAGFVIPISTSPSEGIGYQLIFCLMLVWLAYAITKVFRGREETR